MLLLLDENASDRAFIRELKARGHDVVLSSDVLGYGAPDSEVFTAAVRLKRVLITQDCSDFRDAAASDSRHSGILLIYPTKLIAAQLATAIDHIAEMYADLSGQLVAVTDFWW